MKKQKFQYGDLVHITKDMPSWMTHFENNQDAIILGSYSDIYSEEVGEDDDKKYSVFIKDKGEHSWYREEVLTLIKKNQQELLIKWREKLKRKNKKRVGKFNNINKEK